MSKAIRWQLPFVSVKGIRYRLDIYDDDYTGTPVQLVGSDSPFTTDETNDTDKFCPVRSQTGVVSMVDKDGTLMESIVPANNTHRPIVLTDVTRNEVKWVGFLSCEAYSQTYTARPQILSINCNSVLEALDSVQMPEGLASSYRVVRLAIAEALMAITDLAGIGLFDTVYYPSCSSNFLWKAINMTSFFSLQEQDNENSVTYTTKGVSCKELISRICTYMGWTAREYGRGLYFEEIERSNMYFSEPYAVFCTYNTSRVHGTAAISTLPIGDMQWMGATHNKTIYQGAKSVEVVANLSKYDLKLSLPECPAGSLMQSSMRFLNDYMYLLSSSNITAYSNVELNNYRADLKIHAGTAQNYGTSSFTMTYRSIMPNMKESSPSYLASRSTNFVTFYAGAFFGKAGFGSSEEDAYNNVKDVLYCSFFPGMLGSNSTFDASRVGPIVRMESTINHYAANGYINLAASMEYIELAAGNFVHIPSYLGRLAFSLKFGERWWNGTGWVSTQSIFKLTTAGGNFSSNWTEDMGIDKTYGYLIPVTEVLTGQIELCIWPQAQDEVLYAFGSAPFVPEILFNSLTLSYIEPLDYRSTDRGENHYYRMLGFNFKEEVSVRCELASDMDNQQSPSIILNSVTEKMTTLTYVRSDGSSVDKRPEIDLLNRLANHYSKARRIVELKVDHPEGQRLPLCRIADGAKRYAPLSESRDWQADTSTISMFETENVGL